MEPPMSEPTPTSRDWRPVVKRAIVAAVVLGVAWLLGVEGLRALADVDLTADVAVDTDAA